MNQYEVLEPVTLRAGRYQLTPEQLFHRRHAVRAIEENTVEPIAEISFKRGEIITTDLEVPRVLEQRLRRLTAPSQEPTASEPATEGEERQDPAPQEQTVKGDEGEASASIEVRDPATSAEIAEPHIDLTPPDKVAKDSGRKARGRR